MVFSELYHICLNRAKERLKLIEDWCGDTDSISSHMSGYSGEHSQGALVVSNTGGVWLTSMLNELFFLGHFVHQTPPVMGSGSDILAVCVSVSFTKFSKADN